MKKIKIYLIGLVGVALLFSWISFPYYSSRVVEITVTGKEITASNKGGHYLVFTNKETFKNVDSFAYLKYNSSDIQGKLEEGKAYKVKVNGWRIPLFSKYRNIIKTYEN